MEAQGGFLSESESESENDFYCHIEKFITTPSSHINEPIDKKCFRPGFRQCKGL
jgi:hypothetical protein